MLALLLFTSLIVTSLTSLVDEVTFFGGSLSLFSLGMVTFGLVLSTTSFGWVTTVARGADTTGTDAD